MVLVVDPTQHLYGLTLPLRGVTIKKTLGRVCLVDLAAGREGLIPVAATDLDGPAPVRSPCRLSVAAIVALLTAAASLPSLVRQEDTDAPQSTASHAAPAGAPAHPRSAAGDPPAASVDKLDARRARSAAPDGPAGARGGGA